MARVGRSIRIRPAQSAPFPKGRVLKRAEVDAVRALLGDAPRERALLLEYLHLIQDQEGRPAGGPPAGAGRGTRDPDGGGLRGRDLYAHFDIVGRWRGQAPRQVTIRVCDSLSCTLAGAEELLATLKAENLPRRCQACGWCARPASARAHTAPAAEVGHRHVDHATAASLLALASAGDDRTRAPGLPGFCDLPSRGGYAVLQSCLGGQRTADDGHSNAFGRRPARPRWRRLSNRTQSGAWCVPSRGRG